MSSIMKFDASGLGITATGIHIMPPRAAFGAAAAGASVAMVLRCVWVALVNRFEDANAPGSNAHKLWHRGMCSRSFNTTSSPLSSCAVAASTSGGNFSSTRVRARTSSGQCAGSPHWKLWQAHRVTQPVQQNRWVHVELVVPFGALACALGTSALLDLFGVLLPKSAMAQPSWTGYHNTAARAATCVLRHASSTVKLDKFACGWADATLGNWKCIKRSHPITQSRFTHSQIGLLRVKVQSNCCGDPRRWGVCPTRHRGSA